MSQPPENEAVAIPQPVGSGLPLVISDGIALRGKNQMLILSLVHSVAYTPPPFELKPVPYDAELGVFIWQPAFVL